MALKPAKFSWKIRQAFTFPVERKRFDIEPVCGTSYRTTVAIGAMNQSNKERETNNNQTNNIFFSGQKNLHGVSGPAVQRGLCALGKM